MFDSLMSRVCAVSLVIVCSTGCGGHDDPDAGPVVCGAGADGLVAITLSGCSVLGYGAPVTVGSQQFELLVDTGSTSMIVASSGCTSCSGVSPLYMPGSDAVNTGIMDTSPFGTGTVMGEVYKDSVQLSGVSKGITLGFIAAESQTDFPVFEPVSCEGTSTATAPFQGIIGMGPSDIALDGTESYLAQLANAGIESDIFSVQLCSTGGHLWIGGYDSTCTTAPPQYTALATSLYYAVNISDMGLDGDSLGVSDYGPTVLDTGSSVTILPSDAYNALVAKVVASSGFKAVFPGKTASFFSDLLTSIDPCTTPANGITEAEVNAALLPMTITFPSVSGGTFAVTLSATTSYLDVRTIGGTTVYCPNVVSASDVGVGVPTLIAHSLERDYVTIFDIAQKRVGFAPQQGCD